MTDTNETEINEQDEMTVLKARADDIGIKYSPNIGLDTLRDRVNEALAPKTETPTDTKPTSKHFAMKQKAMALVRVNITCLNPSKRESEGEYFTAGNTHLPTVKRFVPFEQDTHVEQILVNHIKSREYSIVVHEKNAEDRKSPVRKQRKEFQVQMLEPLTEQELKDLAESQIKRNAI